MPAQIYRMLRHLFTLAVVLFLARPASAQNNQPAVSSNSFPVRIEVNAGKEFGEFRPFWRYFGADEPNYATMRDGRKLLSELGKMRRGEVYFRTHNLLTSGDGTPALKWGSTGVYDEDAGGNAIYNWKILDSIFDAYIRSDVRPYVEIGFMPKALSVKPEPYQHQWNPGAKYDEIYRGWAYPPRDYERWAELIRQWTIHCIARYGKKEVEKWYWEVWNEPNIGYWRGSPHEFYKLHDYAVDAVRRALPSARVGGPDVAGGPGGRFLHDFIEHCLHGTNYATGRVGTPLDFLSFHAKGAPKFVEGHVRLGIANQMNDINGAFGVIASFPETRGLPIIIGESDPDGCAACQGPQLGYRNGTMYASYTAACIAREFELMDLHGVNLEGVLTWAFEFENQPYFAGFRVLASNGIDLPVLNVFRMLSHMGGHRLQVLSDHEAGVDAIRKSGVRGDPDVGTLASLDKNKLSLLVWHYHDDDVAGPDADIELTLNGIPSPRRSASMHEFRIDGEHSNAFTAWQRMGSPEKPSAKQRSELEKAGQLNAYGKIRKIKVSSGTAVLHVKLARQSVTLLELEL